MAKARPDVEDAIGAPFRRLVDQGLTFLDLPGAAGDQVDDAAEGAAAVERRRRALDDLDPAEIHRRDLEQAEAAHLASVEWESVEEQEGVTAAQSLHANVGSAERGR